MGDCYNRRAFVTLVGTTGLVGFAGCGDTGVGREEGEGAAQEDHGDDTPAGGGSDDHEDHGHDDNGHGTAEEGTVEETESGEGNGADAVRRVEELSR